MTIKRTTLILFLFILLMVPFSLGADDEETVDPISKSFQLYHFVNVTSDFHFEFWKPGASGTQLQEVFFDAEGEYLFATLMIIYNSRVNENKKLSVTFSRLEDQEKTNFYDYSMTIFNSNGDAIETTLDTEKGHGAGSATLLNKLDFKTYSTTTLPYRDEIASFKIRLIDTDVLPGTYSGTITLVVQNNN